MSSFWEDVRYALRIFAKAPGFSAIAVFTLALGIGANSTIFSWIDSTLLNPVPGIVRPEDVYSLSLGKTAENPFPFCYPDYVVLRRENESLSGILAGNIGAMSLTGSGKPERVWGMVVSANYFDVLGVRPVLGRTFLPQEDMIPGGAPVAVISYRLWQRRFGADPNILGQTIEINRHPFTMVGVTPPVFQGSQTGLRAELWIPIMMEQQVNPLGDLLNDHHYFWLVSLARLKPGVSPRQAEENLTMLMRRIAKEYPEEHMGHDTVTLFPLWRGPYGANAYLHNFLPRLMAIAGVVLLLACANVANLMLVRALGRRRQIAIRLSLGASRWRLVRQLLVESLVLAVAAGAIAMVLTFWTAGTMMRFLPPTDFPVSIVTRVDRSVLLVTLGISVFTGILFGILPALRASSEAPVDVLKEDSGSASGGSRKGRLASTLVVAQISLSLLLLICAGLLIRSFVSAQRFNPGFNENNVLLATYDLFPAGYSEDAGTEFDRQLLEKLKMVSGVESVSLSSRVPLSFGGGSTSVNPEGYVPRANESMEIADAVVGPDYFRTMQIDLVSGREFTSRDTKNSQRVAVVNQAFAYRYWPGQEALGKQLHSDLTNEWFRVVGVARTSKYSSLNEAPQPFVFLPMFQVYRSDMIIHARVAGDPSAYVATIERAVHELNSELPLSEVTTLQSRVQIASFGQRVAGTFVGGFGLLALVLAAVGIYGVTAYTTSQRTREIGIRMALGAQARDIFHLVLGRGIRLTLIGLLIGLVVSVALTRYLVSLLIGVSATDTLTFCGVALLLAAVALAACYFPARRAMRVDPLLALRHE